MTTATFLWEWIVATIVGVLWSTLSSYAYGDACTGSNCWPYVFITFICSCLSTFFYPAIIRLSMGLLLKRWTASSGRRGKKREAMHQLLAAGFGMCLAVSYATFVCALVTEINYTVMSTPVADRSHHFGPGPPRTGFFCPFHELSELSDSSARADARSWPTSPPAAQPSSRPWPRSWPRPWTGPFSG